MFSIDSFTPTPALPGNILIILILFRQQDYGMQDVICYIEIQRSNEVEF